jgi:riboflavin kinase / FMN adenylyltransferase
MKIYRSLDAIPADFGPSALTIGNFDGVHLGHRRIVRRLVDLAREHGWKPSMLTFHPHPTRIVAPERTPLLLSSPERRVEWMAEQGIEQALIMPFVPELAHLSPEDFSRSVLSEKLQARLVVVGGNFHFGFHQAGDVASLDSLGRKYGFMTEIVPPVPCRGRVVGSSGIRELIRSGRLSLAARFLGRPYALEGNVTSGRGVGSKMVVPTLNLQTAAEVIPANGVYATRTTDPDSGRAWKSITNVGRRPTFDDGGGVTVETFLLDQFDGNAPARIAVEFLWRVRGEKKFESPGALREQVLRDVRSVQRGFRLIRPGRWR